MAGFDTPESSAMRAASIAVAVIRWSNRDSPADHILRAELKKTGGVSRHTSRLTARMVFSYYRWISWLDTGAPMETRVHQAVDLQSRFEADPHSFTDDELVTRGVPAWTREVMTVSPAWVRSMQVEPTVWIRAKPGFGETLSAQLFGASPGAVPDSVCYRGEGDLFLHPEFQNGSFEMQDLSSQFVGHICAPKPGETWWDACAGEGGKTMHLSALMQGKGLVWATDRADWRLTRLKRRAARAQAFNYRAARWDGGETLPTTTLFDGVLLDAPCSGLGTWQRNPHARWTTTPADVRELAIIQSRLLDRVAGSVKPGGRLIYSVCTMAPTETTEVTNRFSAAHPEFVLERPALAGLPTSDAPEIWLWPQDANANGMFIAMWRKG